MKNTDTPLSSIKGDTAPIHILEVIGNASFGGMEKYVLNFLSQLPAEEYTVSCICPYESLFTTALRDYGCNVYITPISDDPVWRSIQFTASLAILNGVDVFHAHMPKAHTLAALAANIVKKPVVASVHGMHFSSYEAGVARLLGSHLITNCTEAYGQVIGLGIPESKVSLIYNGVNTDIFFADGNKDALRQSLGLPGTTRLIGYAGRMGFEKGPDTFIRTAHYIHQFMPSVHFAIAGEGDMMEEVKHLCSVLGISEYVHFCGWLDEMPVFYRGIDLLLYTSRSDGTSLALLEAMACGCPAVAMDVGGIRDVVENRNTGLLAPPLRWEDAAIMAKDLLDDEERRARMAAAAPVCVAKKFKLSDRMQETRAVLKKSALMPHAVVSLHGGQQFGQPERSMESSGMTQDSA